MATRQIPKVSVIIPAYNYAHYLPQCINSVLAQEDGNLEVEVIVVDDGSTDNTAETVKAFGSKVRYFFQQNQGAAATRNTGIDLATGQYMMFLDADDLLTPGVLSAHLDNFASQPSLDISVCLCLYFYPAGSEQENFLWPLKAAELDLYLCHRNISPIHAFLLKSDFVKKVGFFDTSFKVCEDHDYWLRCIVAGANIAPTTEGLVLYRGHDGGLTNNKLEHEKNGLVLRDKKFRCLDETPAFPKAGKFLGWIAYASGLARSASLCWQTDKDSAIDLLAVSSKAMLKAAANYGEVFIDNPYLRLSCEYYLTSLFCFAPLFQQFDIGESKKGLGFLSHRFQHLAKLAPAVLDKKRRMLFDRLGCDTSQCMASIRRIMQHDKFLASLL